MGETVETKKMTRKEQAANTKRIISDAVRDLLSKYKFQDISVKMICDAADVSVGSFYHYFPSKDFILLVKNLCDEYFEELLQTHTFTGDTMQDVKFWMWNHTWYVEKEFGLDMQIELFRSQLSHSADSNKEFFIASRPFVKTLKQLLTDGVESGQLTKTIPVKTMVDELLRCSNGTLFDWCIKNGGYNVSEEAQLLVSKVLESYRVPPDTGSDTID